MTWLVPTVLVVFVMLASVAASIAMWEEAERKERVWVTVILAITWAILLPIMLDTLRMIAPL